MNHLGLYSSYNSCTGVSLSSHRLSSLKAVVRNKFLTTANSHRLHSLLLLLWTKWFFRPACLKMLGGAWYSELLIFVSLDKVFSNFFSEVRERGCECFVQAKDRIRCYLKSRALKFCLQNNRKLFIHQIWWSETEQHTFLPYKNAVRLARGHGIL